MKCANCGAEIKEGYLYCENCGEDIHMVPDYEPEPECSLIQSVGEILDEEKKERQQKKEELQVKLHRKRTLVKAGILGGILCLTAVLCGFMVHLIKERHFNSYEYQMEKAAECLSAGTYEKAVIYYERAIVLNPLDFPGRLELAELYRRLGQELQYREQLQFVADFADSSEPESEKAYRKLIAFYDEKGAYETINELLLNCDNSLVKNANQKYLANAPEFSYEEGTYAEIIPLKLTSGAPGTIYYTLDGSVPDRNSEKYTSPLFLETGSHTVTALFVNDYGIVSDVVSKEYVIEVQKPSAPEVLLYSGEYTLPVSITVEILEGCRVFYSTDGTYPTEQSAEYLQPIPLPLGKSYFKFVTYNEEGVAGEIATREYNLTLDSEVTVDEACQAVIDRMLEKGKIYNSTGDSYQVAGRYLYVFQYSLAVPEKGYYYVIAEIYEDSAGIQTKTGSYYAVDIYDETVYKITNSNGNYLLEGF